MPCAAGELCNLADVELIAPNGRKCGHECRGGCGGRLHGMCGEIEDTDSDSPNKRICHTCISKRSLSNPAKRKQGQDFTQPGMSKTHKPGASGAKKPRKRLDLGEKLQIAELLEQKVPYMEIARRFGCGTTAVGSVKQQRETLKAAAATQSRSSSSKSARGGDFLQVENMVVALVEKARKVPLPVTRASIETFGIAAKKNLLAAASTSAADKKKLETFTVSEKWVRNFISRNGMSSVVLHGEAGSVDAEAIAEGLAEIRKACQEYEMILSCYTVDGS